MMQFSAQQIAQMLGGEVIGDASAMVSDVAPIESAKAGTLSFLCDEKYTVYLAKTEASIVLMTRTIPYEGTTAATIIRVENARGAMAQLLQAVAEVMQPKHIGIEQPSFIADGVDVPEDAYVGAFAYIAKGVRIGKNVKIYPQVYVGENVKIGDNTTLYPGVKVYYNCEVGNHCVLHAGVVIGADGFGFEPDAQGVYHKVPQIGNVVIEDDVEIGANTTVDRAMMGTTRVGRNTKLDNLVQVAHGVVIGESTVMCAQAGVAGSTKIGSHCVLAGQSGVAGHIEIADQCVFGAQTGVAGSVRKAGIYQGSPAIDANTWRRASVGFKRLPDMMRQLNEIERKLQPNKQNE